MSAKEIVVPGDLLDDSGDLRPGSNTYREGANVYALRLGLKRVRRGFVDVVALSGRYDPQRNDIVIGTVAEVGPSNWWIDINSAKQVGMHVNEVPWRVDFGETAKYLAIGDTVLLKVYHVDDVKKAQVTMKDRACRKLSGGVTIRVQPSKVPRIIGRQGSMIQTLKDRTDCRIFVGRNGIIWLDGEPEDVMKATAAIHLIEQEAHTSGLTERVAHFLGGGPIDDEGEAEPEDAGLDDEGGDDDEDDDEQDDDGRASDEDDERDDDRDGRRGPRRGRRGGRRRGGHRRS